MAIKPKTTPETTDTDETVDLHELVRVRDTAAGAERTIKRHVAAADTKRYTIVDKPAVNGYGTPLKPKPIATLTPADPMSAGAASTAADTTTAKEN